MHMCACVCFEVMAFNYLVWNCGATRCLKAWCSAPSGPGVAYCGPFDAITVIRLGYKNNLTRHDAIIKLTSFYNNRPDIGSSLNANLANEQEQLI